MKGKTRLETINAMLRPYGLRCYTWSPGDGVTRYRFSRELDSDYFACRVVVTVLGAGRADLAASVWMQGWEAGRELGVQVTLAYAEQQGGDDQGFQEKDAGHPDQKED